MLMNDTPDKLHSMSNDKPNLIDPQYEIITNLFSGLKDKIKVDMENTPYPYTSKALFYGAKKIDGQLQAVFHANDNGHHYVASILFRTIFEHFLVSYYIATKCRVEQNDDAAIASFILAHLRLQ